MPTRRRAPAVCPLALLLLALPAAAQTTASRRVERSVLPALNYDADEGLGYGAIAELYSYDGSGSGRYRWTVQPTLFLTTAGRRDVSVFVDAPRLLPEGWRVTAFAGTSHQVAAPFYGLGNDSRYDETVDAEDGANPHYYRYGVTRTQVAADVQRRVGRLPLRLLAGAGMSRGVADATPFAEGTTLVAESLAALGPTRAWSNAVRAGLVWDTRDREVGARHGAWSEALVQRAARRLGSDRPYTRWTATDRRYATVGRVTVANRLLLQGVEGDAPFFDLPLLQGSFKQAEGLGGAGTLRGAARDRWVGRGTFLWNAEVRWRAMDFRSRLLHRDSHLTLSAFHDQGRVWRDRVRLAEILKDDHQTAGVGARVGLGESFTVAADAGWAKAGAPSVYVGLGYLF